MNPLKQFQCITLLLGAILAVALVGSSPTLEDDDPSEEVSGADWEDEGDPLKFPEDKEGYTVINPGDADLVDGGDDYGGQAVSPTVPTLSGKPIQKISQKRLGRNVTMSCKVLGFPTPKVIWYKDGSVETKDLHHEVINSEDVDHNLLAQLRITSASCQDVGTYFCVAGNFVGRTQKKFLLKIRPCKQ